MRNKDDRQAEAVAQFAEEVEYLGAGGNVQRAYGFVGDEDFWLEHESATYADPLFLTA